MACCLANLRAKYMCVPVLPWVMLGALGTHTHRDRTAALKRGSLTSPGCIRAGRAWCPFQRALLRVAGLGGGSSPADTLWQPLLMQGLGALSSALCGQAVVAPPPPVFVILCGPWESYSSAAWDKVLASGLNEWVE